MQDLFTWPVFRTGGQKLHSKFWIHTFLRVTFNSVLLGNYWLKWYYLVCLGAKTSFSGLFRQSLLFWNANLETNSLAPLSKNLFGTFEHSAAIQFFCSLVRWRVVREVEVSFPSSLLQLLIFALGTLRSVYWRLFRKIFMEGSNWIGITRCLFNHYLAPETAELKWFQVFHFLVFQRIRKIENSTAFSRVFF